jgi:Protein of unknown function (DUF3102)
MPRVGNAHEPGKWQLNGCSDLNEFSNGELQELRFDYHAVTPSVARFLRGQADSIRRQCVTSILQIGKALREAKRHLSHGAFLQWVEWEVCLPARTAQAYMRVAAWAADKGATVAHLSPATLYLLSASSTPDDFVSSVLKRAEAGEYISATALRKELRVRRVNEEQESLRALEGPKPGFVQQAVNDCENCDALTELIAILVRGLSAADYERVKTIMTSADVLTDPDLAQNLELAFAT